MRFGSSKHPAAGRVDRVQPCAQVDDRFTRFTSGMDNGFHKCSSCLHEPAVWVNALTETSDAARQQRMESTRRSSLDTAHTREGSREARWRGTCDGKPSPAFISINDVGQEGIPENPLHSPSTQPGFRAVIVCKPTAYAQVVFVLAVARLG